MRKATIIPLFLFSAIAIQSCGKKSMKGSDLKDQEAVKYLAGDDHKTWKLEQGHDYYEYLEFDTKNTAKFQDGTGITYQLNGANLMIQDFQAFNYTILEVSDDKLVMMLQGQDTLTYTKSSEKIETGKNLAEMINPKWLKGKYGTTWRFMEGDRVYSFMNDGTIIDAKTLEKVDNWSIDGTTLNFGTSKLTISRLSAIFFDYEVYEMKIKLNYVCEAKKDGSPVRN